MFSIIIPVGPERNGATALKSLKVAGLKEGDEVLVIGDGHEVQIADENLELPIRSYSLCPAQGANAARNFGAKEAKGEILCFLDDDDEYAPGALDKILKAMERNSVCGAWALNWRFKSGMNLLKRSFGGTITERKIRKRNHAGGASSMVVRKKVFETVGGFDESFLSMQDWDLWLRLSRATRIRRIKERLVVYDNTGQSRISTNRKARISGLNHLLEKHGAHWSKAVRAFHKSRLCSEIFISGGGEFRDIFHRHAPLASIYFAIRSLLLSI